MIARMVMQMNDSTVEISLNRYDELINIESRMNVLVDRICCDKYISVVEILTIIGTQRARNFAAEVVEKDKNKNEYSKFRRDWNESND